MTGFVVLDKPEGAMSSRETARVKRLTGCHCGHMGTLDPMASGVLPIGIGNACRLFDYFLDKKKTYTAVFSFGEETDTLDSEGTVTERGGRVPAADEIKAVVPKFLGYIMQVPPAYSAKKVGGKRSYELARAGEAVELPPKKVRIYSVDVKELGGADFEFNIVCGGGTYIRSLARDFGRELGTYATMTKLRRTASGPFTIDTAINSRALTKENIVEHIIPTEDMVSFESLNISGASESWLLNGRAVPCDEADGFYKVYFSGEFYGIGEAENQKLKIRTKLC
ncbi:MAG: tRNA pseudouridine(55) synthase TruB [Clostridia bacterium]|nr:tRNA pseudouridine(55) synthase TruB [Clostridia bacterium]